MTRKSRYVRPKQPSSGLVFQDRDYAILKAVHQHRYMYSDHIQQLLFPGLSGRTCLVRLRKLWEHGYLERYFVPFILDGHSPAPPKANQPIYGLGEKGAELLSEHYQIPIKHILYNSPKSPSALAQLKHHLLATDFLVAVQVACQGRSDTQVESIENELEFWSKLRRNAGQPKTYLVPDAAITLQYPRQNKALTFYLEIVKAGCRSGNKTLLQKFRRYAKLHHQGRFKQDYCHQQLRAVIFITTSSQRAKGFKKIANGLPFGHGLFWFGTFNQNSENGQAISSLSAETILQPRWQDPDGKTWSLLNPSNQ